MSLYDLVASLPLKIDGYALEGLARTVSSGFERKSTTYVLQGGGHEGRGEDVTYEAGAHDAQQAAGPVLELAGAWTFDSFSEHLATLDTFPGYTPEQPVYRNYRRWGLESAALDLALRQADTSLDEVLARPPAPVTFVVSSRMGEPPTIAPVARRLAVYPALRFKLDATPDWPEELITALQETGAVDSIDFKGAYKGTVVDTPTDPAFYKHIAESFPDAWLEDPDLESEEARNALAMHQDRITWDAPIHSIDDIEALPFAPKMVNIKPSRFGGLPELFGAYDYCDERGIRAYGGGQFELGVGRGHIQYLASLFHPETPNDVAPSGYNDPSVLDGLASSPLEPRIAPTGFRWEA
jgi:L-alanine-DL-glutamate epimerase-like enolase superfamily enzyme